MTQKLNIKPDEFTSLLINALVKNSLVDGSIIDELLKNRDHSVDMARKQIQGTCYIIDYYEKKLRIFDTYTGEEFNAINLPGKPTDFKPDDFDSWGNESVILNTNELQKEGEIPYDKQVSYGIVLREGRSYLYNPVIDRQTILAVTSQHIFGAIPKKAKTHLPYDMYFSADSSLLCLSNRDEGKVYLFDIELSLFKDEITVRNQGSGKTINLAISMVNKKIYITDNMSPNLIIYDMNSRSIVKKNLYLGILGNLCLAPDEKSIYMVIIKPEQNLKNIDLYDFSEIKSFPVKGELFSIIDAPCDLITLSPDKKYVFSMTFINDPNPHTPVISVIDTEKNKPVKRFSLRDGSTPVNLCFEDINPVGPVNKTLEEMLVEKKLFSINKLRDLKNMILNGEDTLSEEEKEEFVEISGEELEFQLRHDKATSGTHGGVFPRKINHVMLPEKIKKHIKECLVNSFWQKHEIDLTTIPEIQERLDKIVELVKIKLEDYDLEIVEVKGFYDKKLALESIILREYILEMLDEEESEELLKVKTVPTNCPNCRALLLGSWDCATCGFALERPEDALKRKIASVDQLANLAKGNILIIDPRNGELLEVDSFKVPVWKIAKPQLGLQSVTAAIRLENMNTMILDGEAGEIVEITPKGKVSRKFKLNEYEFPLKNPAFFTLVNYDHLLIADTGNHRVMETDLDGNITWEYGRFGISGFKQNYLSSPSYIHKTYDGTYLVTDTGNNRVIELTRYVDIDTGNYEMKIDWGFGTEINIIEGKDESILSRLNNPTMSIKQFSGNILILDTGNKRLIEVSPEKEINWEYNTETDDDASNISNPSGFTILKNKDILLVGDDKYVQIMPSAGNKVIWTSTRQKLALRTNFATSQEQIVKIRVAYGSAPQVRPRAPKYVLRDPKVLKMELEELITQRYMEAVIPPPRWEDSEKPVSWLTPGKTVLPMPVVLIDKVNNKVMLADREANVFWSYGDDKVEKLVRVKMVHITPEKTVLITNGKGLMEVSHPNLSNYYLQAGNEGKLNNPDVLVSDVSERVWVYSCYAQSAVRLENGNTLISDFKKFRVIELNKAEKVVWEHQHISPNALASFATRLGNGNTLITYSSTHIVVEVNHEHKIVWSFGQNKISANDNKHLSFPEYAIRLENGNTLIADSKNSRVIEVDLAGNIVWSYQGTNMLRLISPNFVKRLNDGNTYIVHGASSELMEVDRTGEVVWRMVLPLKR
jgi:hypothetical protein